MPSSQACFNACVSPISSVGDVRRLWMELQHWRTSPAVLRCLARHDAPTSMLLCVSRKIAVERAPPPTCLLLFKGFGYLKLATTFRIMMSLGKGEHPTTSLKYTQTPPKTSSQVGGGALSTAIFLETHSMCVCDAQDGNGSDVHHFERWWRSSKMRKHDVRHESS